MFNRIIEYLFEKTCFFIFTAQICSSTKIMRLKNQNTFPHNKLQADFYTIKQIKVGLILATPTVCYASIVKSSNFCSYHFVRFYQYLYILSVFLIEKKLNLYLFDDISPVSSS